MNALTSVLSSSSLEALTERFWARVAPAPSGCWLWTGGRNNRGYGSVWWTGAPLLAHRVAFEALIGPIPAGLTLDHLCHTNDSGCAGGPACTHRRCVNPTHLEPVPSRVNLLRGTSLMAQNARKDSCKRGHELSGHNLMLNRKGQRACRECSYQRTRDRLARLPYEGRQS